MDLMKQDMDWNCLGGVNAWTIGGLGIGRRYLSVTVFSTTRARAGDKVIPGKRSGIDQQLSFCRMQTQNGEIEHC